MNTEADRPEVLQSDMPERRGFSRWMFPAALLASAVGSAYVILWHGLAVFDFVTARLPLLLPLVVTALSVFTRATSIRNYEAVLKTSNDIAIGIISFDIWALSASRSDASGRVIVNPCTMIRGDFVLALLVVGLFTAVGCLVLTQYDYASIRTKHRALLVGFVGCVVVYLIPFGVLQPVPPPTPAGPPMVQVRHYTVAIPYRDPKIVPYAPTILADRSFVRFERDVPAPDARTAQGVAIQRFLASTESDQVSGKTKSAAAGKVAIRQEEVLVAEQTTTSPPR